MDRDAYLARIAQYKRDEQALATLDHELHALDAPWAGPLRYKVIVMRRELATAAGRGREQELGLPTPDGRPMHCYRVPTELFQRLEAQLFAAGRLGRFGEGSTAPLFVLWAAAWFRRSFDGGQLRWDRLGDHFGVRLEQAKWRDIADRGLRAWKVPPLRMHGTTYRLLNLARQGGFPLAAVEAVSNGWAKDYLGRLVGILLAEPAPGLETALRHAEALRDRIPASWRSQDFLVVSADLALTVATLRMEAAAAVSISGLPASVWLDANRPAWRDRLPFDVDSDAGSHIVDALMLVERTKGGSDVRATRVLQRRGDRWAELLALDLNGCLRVPGLSVSGWSRLRMFGDPGLARHVARQLAYVEPDDTGLLLVQPLGAGCGDLAVPFAVAAKVEMRGGGQLVGSPVLLPHGDALVSELVVTRAEGGDVCPERLVVVGTGSGRYRANPLHVLAPADWQVTGSGDETVHLDDRPHEGRRLWRIDGGATISTPLGDRYRVRAGQTADERDLLLLQSQPAGQLRAVDATATLVCGLPSFTVRENGRDRAPRHDELWWRRAGTRVWMALATFKAAGPCEFAWRDPHSAMIRDSLAITILPKAFKASLQMIADKHVVRVEGWAGDVHVKPGVARADGGWTVATTAVPATEALVSLQVPGSRPLVLSFRLPHKAFIADWDGRCQPLRARIALADMPHLVARSSRRCVLLAQLRDKDRQRVEEAELSWLVEGELPLSSIRDELASLLRPFGDLDATVELQFDDGAVVAASVSEFGIELQRTPLGFVPAPAPPGGARLIGRATHMPLDEAELGEIPSAIGQPLAVPSLPGSWLVYLRRDDRVVSRPLIAFGPPLTELPTCPLSKVMAIADWRARQQALERLCGAAERGGSDALPILSAIVALVTRLSGLPAHTFDVLQAVARRPLLAARLAFEAKDPELDTIMALSDGLPFAWPTIGRTWWTTAAGLHFDGLLAALLPVLGDAEAQAAAASAVGRRSRRIAGIEPAVGALLIPAGSEVTLDHAVQAFMHEAHDQVDGRTRSPFRPSLASRLKDWSFDQAYWRCLDAPLAAVLAATGLAALDGPQLRCVKDVARRHPRYFAHAFAAFLKDVAHA